jgi:hypothetical protein
MKRTLLAICAAAALAIAALPTSADARPFGGHFGHFGHFGWGGPGIAFGLGVAPYAYDYAYGPACYRVHRVWTPFGWRLRRVWVC